MQHATSDSRTLSHGSLRRVPHSVSPNLNLAKISIAVNARRDRKTGTKIGRFRLPRKLALIENCKLLSNCLHTGNGLENWAVSITAKIGPRRQLQNPSDYLHIGTELDTKKAAFDSRENCLTTRTLELCSKIWRFCNRENCCHLRPCSQLVNHSQFCALLRFVSSLASFWDAYHFSLNFSFSSFFLRFLPQHFSSRFR